jgi:hypothetical protein
MTRTYITEQCGAKWLLTSTDSKRADRAFYVFLVAGRSQARPEVIGFYAASINAACNALNN